MFEQTESGRRQGPVTVLALLFGLLFGIAGAPGAQLQPDPNSPRLDRGEVIRTGAVVRISGRSSDEQPEGEDGLALLPPPLVHTALLSVRPATAASAGTPGSAGLDHPFRYHARAPPAA